MLQVIEALTTCVNTETDKQRQTVHSEHIVACQHAHITITHQYRLL